MSLVKKSASAKKAGPCASRKRVGLKPAVKRSSIKTKTARSSSSTRVSVITAGGYTVFGSPVQPAHLTTEQIAQAIAELD